MTDDAWKNDEHFSLWFAPPAPQADGTPEGIREVLTCIAREERAERAQHEELEAARVAEARAVRDRLCILFESELRACADIPSVDVRYLLPFGDYEEERVSRHVAHIVDRLASESVDFYIGICGSPYRRFCNTDHGHNQQWRVMYLLYGDDACKVAPQEILAIDRFRDKCGCANLRRGGGGRGAGGMFSFIYVCEGRLPPRPALKRRRQE